MRALLELAERCEQTTGDDTLELINLECDICAALGIETGAHETPFTSSIDAAMTLVPDGMDCLLWWGTRGGKPMATAEIDGGANSVAATPALVLCAAVLRGRASA